MTAARASLLALLLLGGARSQLIVPSLPEYAALPRARAAAAAFAQRCGGANGAYARHARRYRSVERVVVFDAVAPWATQGLGTLAWWYARAYALGVASERAAFFSNGREPSGAYEPNAYFRADAFTPPHAPPRPASWAAWLGAWLGVAPPAPAPPAPAPLAELIHWNWADAAVRAHVAAAMAAAHDLASADAVIDSVAWCAPRRFEYLVTTRAGGGAERAADAAAWPPPPCDGGAATAAALDDGAAAGRRFDSLEGALAAVASARWVVVRQWGPRVGAAVTKWHPGWLGAEPPRGGGFECAHAAVLRPAPDVQAAVARLMGEAEERPLVGLHVRTLALDIMVPVRAQPAGGGARAVPAGALSACPRWRAARQAALLDLAPAGAGWALWDEMADDGCRRCAADPVPPPPLCAAAGARNATAGALAALGAPPHGHLRRLLACGLARGQLFLATDAAGLVARLRNASALRGALLLSADAPAHAQCDPTRARELDGCGSAARQRRAALKSAVDLTMLAWADLLSAYSRSTFFALAQAANPLARAALAAPLAGQRGAHGPCVRRSWSRKPEAACGRGGAAAVQGATQNAQGDRRCAQLGAAVGRGGWAT